MLRRALRVITVSPPITGTPATVCCRRTTVSPPPTAVTAVGLTAKATIGERNAVSAKRVATVTADAAEGSAGSGAIGY